MSTAVYSVYTPKQYTHNNRDCDKPKRLAKRGWLPLYPAAVVYYSTVCTLHCCCGAAFEMQLPRSLCWFVVLRPYDAMAEYTRKQNNYCKTNTRHEAQPNPHVRRNVYRPLPCMPPSRKLLLLLLLLLSLCCCSVRVRNIM